MGTLKQAPHPEQDSVGQFKDTMKASGRPEKVAQPLVVFGEGQTEMKVPGGGLSWSRKIIGQAWGGVEPGSGMPGPPLGVLV